MFYLHSTELRQSISVLIEQIPLPTTKSPATTYYSLYLFILKHSLTSFGSALSDLKDEYKYDECQCSYHDMVIYCTPENRFWAYRSCIHIFLMLTKSIYKTIVQEDNYRNCPRRLLQWLWVIERNCTCAKA